MSVAGIAVGTQDRSRVSVLLCFLVALVEGFDIQAIGIAAPRLAPELGLSAASMGWVFSIGNVGFVIGAASGGWLADRIGRKPVFVASVALFGLFTLLTALVSGFTPLFAVRLLAGLAFGAALPIMMTLAAEVALPHRRALTASMMFCGMPLGGGLAALLTQAVPGHDWRMLFHVGGIIPLLLVPALLWLLPETLRPGGHGAGPRVSVWQALFGGGRAAATMLLWATFLPTLIILYLILNWLPTLVVAKGMDASAAPQASLAFNFAAVVGALLIGRLVDRFEPRWPLVLAYLGLVATLLALSQSGTHATMLIFSAAAGFFVLGANYALYGVAATYYDSGIRGTGSGASISVGRLGAIIGPGLAGFLLSGGVSAASVVGYLVPFAVFALLAVFMLSFCRRPSA